MEPSSELVIQLFDVAVSVKTRSTAAGNGDQKLPAEQDASRERFFLISDPFYLNLKDRAAKDGKQPEPAPQSVSVYEVCTPADASTYIDREWEQKIVIPNPQNETVCAIVGVVNSTVICSAGWHWTAASCNVAR